MYQGGPPSPTVDRTPAGVDSPSPTSPWPVFVALGIALSELGVLMGGPMIPVAVGGIVLLEASIVGVLRESGYVSTLWPTAIGVGAVFLGAGLVLVALTGIDVRGTAIALAGGVAVVAGIGLWVAERYQKPSTFAG